MKKIVLLNFVILLCAFSASSQGYTLTLEEHATNIVEGQTTYRLYVDMVNSDDFLHAIYGGVPAPLSITTSTGSFYNQIFGGEFASDINPAFLPFFPEQAADSWMTIGIDQQATGDECYTSLTQDPAQPFSDCFDAGSDLDGQNFVIDSQNGGAWYVLNGCPNGLPDENMRVLFLQMTTAGEICGTINVIVFESGVGTAPLYLTATFCGEGTYDFAGVGEGCTDPTACNYDLNSTENDGSCYYSCQGCTDESACNFDTEATIDDGSCIYATGCETCSGETDGTGTIVDNDADDDGVCDADEVAGCQDATACNYNAAATDDASNCVYATGCETCSGATDGTGTIVDNDADDDGVCDADEIAGCQDATACNYNSAATDDDGSCIPSGCMEPEACNYNALAECEGEACDFTCCPGPGCCSAGMYWDYDVEQCMNYETCQDDLDGDGVIGVNDLMHLLSSFGTDCSVAGDPETAEWTCGDLINYHGYNYSTVAIGDQCWFAENLRTEHYANGDTIPSNLTDDEWATATSGAVAVYGEDDFCGYSSPAVDACNPAWSLNEYGRLYNWYAADDSRGLCPTGWHVPTDGEWMILEMELGMSESDANEEGWRGTDQGTQMKTTYGWNGVGNGSNSSGFSGLPGGSRGYSGYFGGAGTGAKWWSSSPPIGSSPLGRALTSSNTGAGELEIVLRGQFNSIEGFSVRCLKD